VNIPPTIATAISSGRATMAELATVLSLEDLHDILEVVTVDSHNRRVAAARAEREREKGSA
jgi:hypothetical protein